MPYISRQQMLDRFPNRSPETDLLINYFYSTFDNRAAANRTIINVEPLAYQGVIAGSEFLTYAATKLYLCFTLDPSNTAGAQVSGSIITFYNELNAVNLHYANNVIYWDATATALRFVTQSLVGIKNLYFSRIVSGNYTHIKFIGYRITLV